MNNRDKIIQDYIAKHGIDPNQYRGSSRYRMNQAIEKTDAYQRTRKYQNEWLENEAKAKKRDADKLLKTIQKFRKENSYDPETERLSNLLDKYRDFYGTNVNSPVTKGDLEAFAKGQKKYPQYFGGEVKEPKKEESKKDDESPLNKFMDFVNGLKDRGDRTVAKAVNSAGFNVLDNVADMLPDNKFGDVLRNVKLGPMGTSVSLADIQKAEEEKSNSFGGKALDVIGEGAGYLVPGTGAYKLVKGVGKLAQGTKAADKLSKLPKVLQRGLEGAGASTLFAGADAGLTEAIAPEERNLSDHLKRAGIEVGLGAVGDAVAPILLKQGSRLFHFFRKEEVSPQEIIDALDNPSTPQVVKDEILLLNEGQKLLPEPQPTKKPNFTPADEININGTPLLEVPKTQTAIPFNRTNEYAQKFTRLVEEANKIDMFPGREREIVEDLWNRMKDYNDPSLDELIRLATPSLLKQNPSPNLIHQARQNQSKSAYGLDTLFNRLKKVNEPVPYPKQEGTPLSFKQEKYVVNKEQAPLNYTGQLEQPLVSTKVQKRDNFNDFDSLSMGDKIRIKQGRGEREVEFVTKSGDSVVIRNSKGREVVIPASDVVGSAKPLQKLVETLNPNKKVTPKEQYENISPSKGDDLTYIDNDGNYHDYNATELKDIGGFTAATNDVHRIFEKVFKKDFPKVKQAILDPLDNAKSEFVDMQKRWVNELDENIVKKYGIKKGSKESALVQQFGEGEIGLDELKRRAPSKWGDIVEADKWFRKAYDELIDEVNKSRAVIYPNNPDKLVPKRKDYYRHFREMNGLSGLKNLFETPAAIDPHLAGTSQYTKPKSKFAGYMQKRGNGPFKRDAVGGFLEYIPAASYSTKIDPMIPKFRELKNSLADRTEDSKNLNTFIEFLDDYANDLSGKTNPFDRVPQKYIPGGRKTFAFLNKLNSRVKANVILGNVSSALAQTANIPIGVAYGKQHAVNGVGRTLTAIFDKTQPMYKSNFLKERYSQQMYRKFDEKWFQQPKKMAEWMIETSDKIGSSFVWNTAYQKALKNGVKNPIQQADNETRKLIAGRGVGEVPLFQKAKTTQMILPFTLEVANQWRVMGDMVKGKDITGLMTLFLGNYLINRAMEETRGFGVTFDPIQAIVEAVNEEDASPVEKGGRVAGEVLSNTPAGQYLASLYPEYGFKIPFTETEAPTREQFFGERNPQRFGTGLVAVEGVYDPLVKLALPFGGNQVKKTIQGINALKEDGVYKDEKLKYPIESDAANTTKGLLFGPSSFSETDAYYDSNNRPLSEKQTKEYERAKEQGKGLEYFKNLQQKRDSNTLQRKIKDVQENKTLTEKEKKEKLERLLKQLRELK